MKTPASHEGELGRTTAPIAAKPVIESGDERTLRDGWVSFGTLLEAATPSRDDKELLRHIRRRLGRRRRQRLAWSAVAASGLAAVVVFSVAILLAPRLLGKGERLAEETATNPTEQVVPPTTWEHEERGWNQRRQSVTLGLEQARVAIHWPPEPAPALEQRIESLRDEIGEESQW